MQPMNNSIDLINEPEIARLRFSTLRDLMTPFGYEFTVFGYDAGLRVSVKGPGVSLSASADDGDWYTAAGLLFTKMNDYRLIPESVYEVIVNG